jgi:chemosensory pili system protein ChpA (sensor histidine kinase/response regulator)
LAELIARVPDLPTAADLDLALPALPAAPLESATDTLPVDVPRAEEVNFDLDLGALDEAPAPPPPAQSPATSADEWAELLDLPLDAPAPEAAPALVPTAEVESLEIDLEELQQVFGTEPTVIMPPPPPPVEDDRLLLDLSTFGALAPAAPAFAPLDFEPPTQVMPPPAPEPRTLILPPHEPEPRTQILQRPQPEPEPQQTLILPRPEIDLEAQTLILPPPEPPPVPEPEVVEPAREPEGQVLLAASEAESALDLDLALPEPAAPDATDDATPGAAGGVEVAEVVEVAETAEAATDLAPSFDVTAPIDPQAFLPPPAEPQPSSLTDFDLAEEEQVKVIGPLRISIPLFNIYLNEADELSRRLGTELAEWALEHERHPVPASSVALAHSLAGSSATVGYADLSALARALEHALERSRAAGHGRDGEAQLFNDAAEEIRRLLHQFAAGFLRTGGPGADGAAGRARTPAAA